MRVAIGGIAHESSTFATVPTTLDDFVQRGYHEDAALIEELSGTKSGIGGFIDAARVMDFEVVPTIMASAQPAG
ncbi:MAG: M81 family metallopeptidase, partial [Vicinamibacterales bacterium]